MGSILQIVVIAASIISLIALYFFYKFYIQPKQLMGYYERQGVKNLCFYPFLGKFKQISEDLKSKGDGYYSIKQFLNDNPGCKFSMTNLAEYVIIQLYDPDVLKEFYNCKSLEKDKFGVEIFQEFMNGIVFSEGQEHTRKRKIISQAFHYQLLQNMVPQLSEIYDEYINKVKDTRTNDCISLFQEISSEAVMRLFFSKSFTGYKYKGKTITEHLSILINSIGQLVKSIPYALLGKWILKFGQMLTLKNNTREIKQIFKEVITNRLNSTNLQDLQHKKRKDLIDYLIENKGITDTESEDTITVETIIEEFMTFYVAGLDTTGHTLGMAIYYLSIYPEVFSYFKIVKNSYLFLSKKCTKQLQEEIYANIKTQEDLNSDNIKNMKYLQAFVNEILRHYTIADQLFARKATQDILLGTLKIKKGTLLNVGNLENHYDSKYFKNPHQFDPSRWLSGSLDKLPPYIFNPFSAGKHNCIGQHFAQINIKIGLIKFIQAFNFECDPDYKLLITFKFLIEPLHPIPILFKTRKV